MISFISSPNRRMRWFASTKLFRAKGVELEFEEAALKRIAAIAVERKGGARSLRSIVESSLLDIEYEVPYQADIEKCTITADVIDGQGKPKLAYSKRKTA